MKIAILGTRGIPNNYGGFEQCAENISQYISNKGYDVTVYNPSEHYFKEIKYFNVKIKRIFSIEKLFSFFNVFIFDYLCLRDAIKNSDIILELGYHPASLFYYLNKNSKTKIITNMAGLEWKRSKWNKFTQKLIKYCEQKAVEMSDLIITDNTGITEYFIHEYNVKCCQIAYGAELFNNPRKQYLKKYNLVEGSYYMQMARFQPDNNFDMVIKGFIQSKAEEPLIILGNYDNSYGQYLKNKYLRNKKVRFLGGIYDYDIVSTLRWFSKIYFHGHSCGGTNPSLLEAMASNAFIAAYDNKFNRNVLNNNGFYFKNSHDVKNILIKKYFDNKYKHIEENRNKIKNIYNWELISEQYLNCFLDVCSNLTKAE